MTHHRKEIPITMRCYICDKLLEHVLEDPLFEGRYLPCPDCLSKVDGAGDSGVPLKQEGDLDLLDVWFDDGGADEDRENDSHTYPYEE